MPEVRDRVRGGALVEQLQWLSGIIEFNLEQGKAISLWRLPGTSEKNLIITNQVEILKSSEIAIEDSRPGFVMSPFGRTLDKYFLPADQRYTIHDGYVKDESGEITSKKAGTGKPKFHRASSGIVPTLDRDTFKGLVELCISEIESGRFEKVVPSRCEVLTLPENTDLLQVFERLCSSYPHAFVSLTSTPLTGTWMGASPELLVTVDSGSTFRTTALASTQAYHPGTELKEITWNQKEIEEQALVGRYIINCFKKIRLREFEEHGPRTFRAGNLLHLKTDFSVDMRTTNFPQLGSVMLQLLHPTSAVCGMPLEPALEFLASHEKYDRQFFTGFLGPVNFNSESHLYVQLRCMQVNGNRATLYAGAGVTIDSNPELEWEETVMKMSSLREIILA